MPEQNGNTSSTEKPNTTATRASNSPGAPTSPSPSHWHPLLDNRNRKWMKRYRTEISACSASLLATFTAYPLDSIKTRMQTFKFTSFLGCVRHTYETEGSNGFLRGVFAPLMSITLVRTISFSIYQKAKYNYDGWICAATGSSPLQHANTRDARPTLSTMACFGAAGATSGALTTFISCPFELTKVNSQIAVLMEDGSPSPNGSDANRARANRARSIVHPQNTGALRTAREIIKHKGLLGMYSGYHLHLLRDTIGSTIYFTTYESSKQLLANSRGNSPTSPLAVVIAGGLCGLTSWICIYPIDSAKSIYQHRALAEVLPSLSAVPPTPPPEDPLKQPKMGYFNRRMYQGLGVSMARSCLINAIFFSVFELMKKWVNRLEVDECDE